MKKSIICLILVITFIVGINLPLVDANQATDISTHQAVTEINKLLSTNVLSNYSADEFKPDALIKRGELAASLAKLMDLEGVSNIEIEDLKGHEQAEYITALVEADIMSTLAEDKFKPNNEVTRAQLAEILSRALEIDRTETKIRLRENIYQDIVRHSAKNSINLISKLGLFTDYSGDNFKPDNYVTRAEIATILNEFANLKVVSGSLTEKYSLAKKIRVATNTGQSMILDLKPDALLGRNNQIIELDTLQNGDQVHLILDSQDEIKYLKAYGVITQDDIITEVSNLTQGLLDTEDIIELSKGNFEAAIPKIEEELKTELSTMTNGILAPDEIAALSQGNFQMLEPKLKSQLKEALVEQGLSYSEAEAVLNTDWNHLQTTGKLRLMEAISIQTGIPMGSINAIINQDWSPLREMAEQQLMQRLTTEILNSGLLS
ncbi:S-layer homology domain-containing protein [Fuchsiella alkaliacetigena]|uniref:S-layer homology domain-containing protein n=1 Tax=Fuchsiella alkaliacetigena TaxID=957042 RepID=UPI00200AB35C|nr:S-layer homology domain-containing protein [Fuchsiella alkaliacetigena]MCK8824009.1 S-layer homology domain-containing protein [Fuchsiella alkaliacetigena]